MRALLSTFMTIAILCTVALQSTAQSTITPSLRRYFNASDGMDPLHHEDNLYASLVGSTATEEDRQSMGAIEVGFEPDDHACYADYLRFEVELTYDWEERTAAPNTFTTHSAEQRTFIIDYDPDNTTEYREKAILYLPNCYSIDITAIVINAFDITNTPVPFSSNLNYPGDFYLQLSFDAERYGDFDYTVAPSNFRVDYLSSSDQIQFAWNLPSNGEYEVEIEWVYINDYETCPTCTTYAGQVPASSLDVSFTYNATRVRVPAMSTAYFIPAAFDRGYIAARIRGIGRDPNNLDREAQSYWSFQQAFGTTDNLSTDMNANHYDAVPGHENGPTNNKNWQSTATFAEEGKNKFVLGYADGSFRTRQMVTLLSTENQVVVAQTIYDYTGRAAIQTLPAPVVNSKIQYYTNFNTSSVNTSDQVTWLDFDLDQGGCLNVPVDLSTGTGAGRYYSTNNSYVGGTNKENYIADAGGYPYTITQFEPDNTGRIRRQSGVGVDHMFGSGRETRYFYGKPLQEQIDMLFGTDVGYAKYYKKNMVIDANGQISVSYIDMAGRVIATSLAGDIPVNMVGLEGDPGDPDPQAVEEAIPVTADMLNISANAPHGEENIFNEDGTALVVNTTLMVVSSQTYTFDYTATGLDYMDECIEDFCVDCMYDVEISIKDECGNEKINGGIITATIGGTDLDDLCNETNGLTLSNFTASLDPGTYQLTKKLTLNAVALEMYVDSIMEHDTCILPVDSFFVEPDTMGCAVTCEQCEEELEEIGTLQDYIDDYLENLEVPDGETIDTEFYTERLTREYNTMVRECEALCSNPGVDLCDLGYQMLLADMSPDGQYGEYLRDEITGVADAATIDLSVYNENNTLPRKDQADLTGLNLTVSDIPNWRTPRAWNGSGWDEEYQDEEGNRARIYLDQDIFENYIPLVVDPGQILYDAALDRYYTWPENLANLTDFVNRWQPGWAKSLVVFHPEYWHYHWCANNTYDNESTLGGTYNSHQFDQELVTMDYATATSDITNMNDIRLDDPFFINHGTDALPLPFPGCTTVDDLMNLFLTNVVDFTTTGGTGTLNAYQAAFHANHYGSDYTVNAASTVVSECGSCPNDADYLQNDADWGTFASFYLSAKQKTMHFLRSVYAFQAGNMTNRCIGVENFDPEIFTSLLNNVKNPCNLTYFPLYNEKDARFPIHDNLRELLDSDNDPPTVAELQEIADQQYYHLTGICPMARDFEAFLNQLARSGNLTSTVSDIQEGTYLSKKLWDEWEPGNLNNVNYVPVLSTDNRVLTWNMNVTGGTCPMVLTIPPGVPATVDFTDVEMIRDIGNVSFVGSQSTFTIKIYVLESGVLTPYVIQGTVCMDLENCVNDFNAVCHTTEEAKQLIAVINRLSEDGHFDDVSPYTLTSDYDNLMGPELTSYLGAGGPYTWTNTTTNVYELKNTFGSKNITITITGNTGVSYTDPFLVKTIIKPAPVVVPSPTTTNAFEMHVFQDVGLSIPPLPNPFFPGQPNETLTGTITKSWPSVSAFPVSVCEMVADPECDSKEHRSYKQFRTILTNLVATQDDDFPITPNQCIQDMTWAADGTPVDYTEIVSIVNISLANSLSENAGASTHYFIATVIRTGGAQEQITGRYCEPMKECVECSSCTDEETAKVRFTFPSSMSNTEAYRIVFPFDGHCFDLADGTEMHQYLTGSFTNVNQYLNSWAAALEAGNPLLDVTVDGLTLILEIPSSALGSECSCSSGATIVLQRTASYPTPDFSFYNETDLNCCEPAPDPGCRAQETLTLTYNNIGNLGWSTGDKLRFDNMNEDCIPLGLDMEFERTTDILTFFNNIVAYINANTIATANYNPGSGTLTITVPTDILGETCQCSSMEPVRAYRIPSGSVIASVAGTANINCCLPLPNQDCYEALETIEAWKAEQLAELEEDYQTLYGDWVTNCVTGDPFTPECNEELENINIWYNEELEDIEAQYQHVVDSIRDTCDIWDPLDTLTIADRCDPEMEPVPGVPYDNRCADQLYDQAWHDAQVAYEEYLAGLRGEIRRTLIAHCMGVAETFTMEYTDQEYHFTLYYYDQAGNLVKTVPPRALSRITNGTDLAAVKTKRDANSGTEPPGHNDPGFNSGDNFDLCTEYRYNSLNQPIVQKTPDGGESHFWYDELGRLVFSQNARQDPNDEYSYTEFDAQGRITEVGQLTRPTVALTQVIAGVSASRASWLSGVTLRTEVTQTFYDIDPGINGTVTGNQLNLRKRVAATTYEHIFDGNDNTYNTASFYSYDIHGNVKQLWQYNGDIPVMGQELKTMHYYYDLVSGKVNSVAYNPGEPDQYFHRYEYDADNRITKAYTWEGFDYSTIGWNPGNWEDTKNPLELLTFWPWDEDGRYFYYRHGPLSRTEIGDLKVQGLDYIYTIHGWIKAVNSNTLADSRDPGLDGCNSCTTNPNQWVARDAMSYMLDYYSTDYAPIGGSGPDAFRSGKNGSGYGGNIIDLFNGNISGMTTTLKEPANYTIHPQGTEYYYDQLNRLVEMTVYQDLDRTTNDWDTESPLTDYHEEYTYDANGNILSLLRNGHNTINTQMDDLSYTYATNNNKLLHVDDAVSSGNYPTDIDDQAANNYDYDQIGNLIEDVAEEISNIDWTVYGKVKSVTRTMLSTKPELTFTYGPDGQRVTKRVDDGTDITSTYYVRDASGNIMATYQYVDHSATADEYYLQEHHIYGNSRLGTRQKQTDLLTSPTIPPDQTGIIYVERGYKRYELTNHLGNVLTVVSDRRQQGSCTGVIVNYYEADIINAQDYYPFGAVMPEREWSNGSYRFGFNGQMRDDEVYGEGNAYTAEYWEYDPRIGRRWNMDLLVYPYHSPYATFNNNPILYNDPSGLEPSPTRQAKKYAKELKKQGITNYTVNSWTGEDGGKYASVDWNTANGEEAIANTKVFREDRMQTYYRNTRDRYWNEGDWVGALSYQMKLWWGNESDDRERAEQFEPIAKLIAEFHPAIGIYNVGNGTIGDGTNIWGEDQNATDIVLSGFGFIPVGKIGKLSYGLIGKLGKNYKIVHQGNLTKYLFKKGWTSDEIIEVIENNNKVLHKTPVDNHITNKQMYRYIHPTESGKDLIMDSDGVIIQLGGPGYTW